MFRHALLHLMVPAALLVGMHAASAESRLALVIGQSAYKSVPALPNPINDAKAVTQMLTDSGFEVSTASDLSQSQIRDQLNEFAGKVASKGGDSIALVFYAGHGVQIDGENFLLPVDIDPKRESDIPIQAVRLNDVLNTLTSAPSKMRILLLDACRNNPFEKTMQRTIALKLVSKGLSNIEPEAGFMVVYAAKHGETALDGDSKNSPFATVLARDLKEPKVEVRKLFDIVRDDVWAATKHTQQPFTGSPPGREDFYFVAEK